MYAPLYPNYNYLANYRGISGKKNLFIIFILSYSFLALVGKIFLIIPEYPFCNQKGIQSKFYQWNQLDCELFLTL